MNTRHLWIAIPLAAGLCACHHAPVKPVDMPQVPIPVVAAIIPPPTIIDEAPAEIPCPVQPARSAPAPKPRPKPAPPPASADAFNEGPSPAPKAADAKAEPLAVSATSILGKRVRGENNADLGRIVDMLADASGRMRLVIVEYGGFLGVGIRRVAVDWRLLHIHPNDQNQPVSMNVTEKQLQATPAYNPARPQALTLPAASRGL
ncbi:MAG TPA: PRC-barrel domain-containing protein [Steroidobacteraceae bacterium]|jgi:hypothetical protein|nr:PRC-barrel domain-containing protein [Steroidobacteraceae bacterium]